jgi:hypothetical protein
MEEKKYTQIENAGRRKAVKAIVGGVTALAAYNVLPVRWGTPIIEQVFLPAHAATSGASVYSSSFDTDGETPHTFTVTITGSTVTFTDENPNQSGENISGSGTLGGTIVGSNASIDTTIEITSITVGSSSITISIHGYQTSDNTDFGTFSLTLPAV